MSGGISDERVKSQGALFRAVWSANAAAWQLPHEPKPGTLLLLLSVAAVESSLGLAPVAPNNYGSIQCAADTPAELCVDAQDNHADGTPYVGRFRSYATPADGISALMARLVGPLAGPRAAFIEPSSVAAAAEAMHASRYYELQPSVYAEKMGVYVRDFASTLALEPVPQGSVALWPFLVVGGGIVAAGAVWWWWTHREPQQKRDRRELGRELWQSSRALKRNPSRAEWQELYRSGPCGEDREVKRSSARARNAKARKQATELAHQRLREADRPCRDAVRALRDRASTERSARETKPRSKKRSDANRARARKAADRINDEANSVEGELGPFARKMFEREARRWIAQADAMNARNPNKAKTHPFELFIEHWHENREEYAAEEAEEAERAAARAEEAEYRAHGYETPAERRKRARAERAAQDDEEPPF